mgnify:CR=1 FL=1
MRDAIVIAVNAVHDYCLICKDCIKAYIIAKKSKALYPWQTAKFTAQMMYRAHTAKIANIKNRNKIKPVEGEYLDRYAEQFGVRRNGRTDKELRQAMLDKMTRR